MDWRCWLCWSASCKMQWIKKTGQHQHLIIVWIIMQVPMMIVLRLRRRRRTRMRILIKAIKVLLTNTYQKPVLFIISINHVISQSLLAAAGAFNAILQVIFIVGVIVAAAINIVKASSLDCIPSFIQPTLPQGAVTVISSGVHQRIYNDNTPTIESLHDNEISCCKRRERRRRRRLMKCLQVMLNCC